MSDRVDQDQATILSREDRTNNVGNFGAHLAPRRPERSIPWIRCHRWKRARIRHLFLHGMYLPIVIQISSDLILRPVRRYLSIFQKQKTARTVPATAFDTPYSIRSASAQAGSVECRWSNTAACASSTSRIPNRRSGE